MGDELLRRFVPENNFKGLLNNHNREKKTAAFNSCACMHVNYDVN